MMMSTTENSTFGGGLFYSTSSTSSNSNDYQQQGSFQQQQNDVYNYIDRLSMDSLRQHYKDSIEAIQKYKRQVNMLTMEREKVFSLHSFNHFIS